LSHWNFRIVRHDEEVEEWYGIHEVYYDDEGKVCLTVDPVPLCADTLELLRGRSEHAFEKPILNYSDH
jgi:hypothetical protein